MLSYRSSRDRYYFTRIDILSEIPHEVVRFQTPKRNMKLYSQICSNDRLSTKNLSDWTNGENLFKISTRN